MKEIIPFLQFIISLFLMAAVLLQSRGSGLGRVWGGGGEFYHSRRGIEKLLQRITVALAVVFLVSSFVSAAF